MTTIPPAERSELREAFVSALGNSVSTDPERRDEFVADTYGPALQAAPGARRSRTSTSCHE